MNVSAIVVTRGNVSLAPIWESLPDEWEYVVWNNGAQVVSRTRPQDGLWSTIANVPDLSVYGRYAAIEYARHDLIYVQDDDVIVGDPQAIVREWQNQSDCNGPRDCVGTERGCDHCGREPWLVANMPQEFRHDAYTDSCLVGFGACFHRDLPKRAFARFAARELDDYRPLVNEAGLEAVALFNRTCDVVFTTLTPRVLVDVPKTDREFASDDDRLWRQPGHVGERTRMLELARAVRDA